MTCSNGGGKLFTRAILATTLAAAAWGDSVKIGPSKDNTLYESATGSRSNGAGQYLFVGRTNQQSDSRRRGVVAFDIAGNIPADATIDSVTLTLHMSRTKSAAQTISLHRLNADWGEGTSNAGVEEGKGAPSTTDDATWKHTFYDTKNWSNAGGDYQAAASANMSVAGVGFYSWVSTSKTVADVQGWLDNPSGSFGWILIGNEGTPQTAKRFDTRENPDSGKRPVLTVVFTPPLPPPDCNGNGVDDATDIANGTSQDCNGNGIPDECDIDPADPDGNGLVSTDCDGNGVPDECQTDSDNDGVIDACDNCPNDANKTEPGGCGCGTPDTDKDGDGVFDCLDLCPGQDDTLDSDNDGVPDCLDACPNDPKKTEPGDCGCGQPDIDSDGDGVPDCADRCEGGDDAADRDGDQTPDFCDECPDDPNKIVPGLEGCGVAEADSDGDGVPDSVDGCPNDPNKSAPGDCGCGQPETDSDGDGVPDCLDGCPDDPNKIAPGDCGCGQPETDTDGDGIPDCLDGCPDDPNKSEPGDCGCGEPDVDSDADGILDCVDNCPETANPDQADVDGDGVGDVCDADFVVDDPDENGQGDQDPPPDDNTDGMTPADCGADLCGPGMMPVMPLMILGMLGMKARARRMRRSHR